MPQTSTLRPKEHLHFTYVAEAGHFDDIVDSFRLAAEALGHPTSFAASTLQPDAVNIILFAWRVQWPALAGQHPRCIVFNFEHLTADSFCFTESYREVLQKCYLWDYSPTNFHKNLTLGFHAADYVPLAYQPGAGTELSPQQVLPDAEQDIDVVFFGATTPRRMRVLNALLAQGVRVLSPATQAWSNAERDDHLRRAKLVLNIHQFDDSRIVEIPRLTILLRNRKAVVCELYPDSDIDPVLREAVEGARYEALVDTTLRLLADPARRAELERVGYERLVTRPQVNWLAPALTRYFQWLAQQTPVATTATDAVSPGVSVALRRPDPALAAQTRCVLEPIQVLSAAERDSVTIDPQATTVLLPGPVGRARARDAALHNAQADFIVFWEPDDLAAADRLQRQATWLTAHPEIDIVGSWLERIDGHEVQLLRAPELDHEIRAEFLGTARVLQARTCMYRRQFLLRHDLRHDAAFDGDEDEQYFLAGCAIAGARFAAIPEALCRQQVQTTPPGIVEGLKPLGMRARRALLAACFPDFNIAELETLLQLHDAYWPPDAAFAAGMLGLLTRAASSFEPGMHLERSTVTRTLRQEAVRLVRRYRGAGLIDNAWLLQQQRSAELAQFLAPARDQLMD